MPDTRRHRGPHPRDAQLFSPPAWPALRAATRDVSWLLSRGYAEPASLKLVGDRLQLTERQRLAVMRSACSDQARQLRRRKQHRSWGLFGARTDIDGFNLLTTVEAALSGGVLLWARDRCYRDMASMHGTFRRVAETRQALALVGQELAERRVATASWYLDRPVSNSGRLAAMIREIAAENGWPWSVELVDDPDKVLGASPHTVASADSIVLDRCQRWVNLARELIERQLADVQVIPMGVA